MLAAMLLPLYLLPTTIFAQNTSVNFIEIEQDPSGAPVNLFNLISSYSISLSTLADGQTPQRDSNVIYTISSAEELKLLSSLVAAGDSMAGVNFWVTSDITINEGSFSADGSWSESGTPEQWIPIGNSSTPFSGNFYGGNSTLSGLYTKTDRGYAGLFGYIQDAYISNVNITNSYFSASYYVGGIAGYAVSFDGGTTITGCNVKVHLSCTSSLFGSIAGYAAGMGSGTINVSRCETYEGIKQIGAQTGNVELTETKFVPYDNGNLPADNGGLFWLIIIIAIIAVVIIFIIFIHLKKAKSKTTETKSSSGTGDETRQKLKDKSEITARAPENAETEENITKSKSDDVASISEEGSSVTNSENITNDNVCTDSKTAYSRDNETSTVVAAAEVPAKPDQIGYFYIKRIPKGGFSFRLKAANHETLAVSGVFSNLAECKIGIQSLISIVPDASVEINGTDSSQDDQHSTAPKFEIYTDKLGNFSFRLVDANNEILATSPGYITLNACKNSIEKVRKNATTNRIIIESKETSKRSEQLHAEIIRAKRITVEEANVLIDDSSAELLIEETDPEFHAIEDGIPATEISVDILGENFENGDRVTLASLISKKLLPADATRLCVIAHGSLDKELIVEADIFTPEAVKMIVLAGGRAIRRNKQHNSGA